MTSSLCRLFLLREASSFFFSNIIKVRDGFVLTQVSGRLLRHNMFGVRQLLFTLQVRILKPLELLPGIRGSKDVIDGFLWLLVVVIVVVLFRLVINHISLLCNYNYSIPGGGGCTTISPLLRFGGQCCLLV